MLFELCTRTRPRHDGRIKGVPMNEKILVGMSGGVDSSVALGIVRDMGYLPTGLYLDMLSCDDEKPVLVTTDVAYGNKELESAFQCAEINGISLYKLGCKSLFDREIICHFANEYLSGRTPNPCTVCNRKVKIQKLIEAADFLGCKKVATGHYAKIGMTDKGRYFISRGADPKKDQSYMLCNLTQQQLSRLVLPLGRMDKSEIYEIARKKSYTSAEMKESLDICFLPDGVSYAEYIEERFGKCPSGDFISPDGKVCGTHKGIIHYTVGQRKGLGVALGEPVFILSIDKESNSIKLGRKTDEGCTSFTASCTNSMKYEISDGFCGKYSVKVRYAASPVEAFIEFQDGILRISTNEPVRAVTPGQTLVVYEGDDVVLGGVIN